MDRDTFKKDCKAQLRNPDDHGYIFVNTRKPAAISQSETRSDINQDVEYAEENSIIQDIDNPITQQIDELEEEIATENSGQGITFLSDNNEELLKRLEIILAAMKEGHRSDRQYNEVNCILKRFLEKGIIDKNDYKNVIDKIIQ
ncbi:hypothetical protein LOTGIDRAFT_155665 [Lottia gigantea]|uniref:Uncharacterized protein n=1 Tax=Lottia gigantea TaxID=225164 RepID=V3ZEX0_LOTGI|nr:hypothetical protein LOTGIDRAFT_155665 [Lottia gigantea]ESO82652.1 hypothetical protein LOTGIDRAFT_155665 [Lottia gigantea]